MVALGLSRSLVTGDGPNFATASVSMQKMMVMIREIKQAARKLLDWVFDDWMELNGHGDKSISSSSTTSTPATRSISRSSSSNSTTQTHQPLQPSSLGKMDLDPDIEAANRETERKQIDLMDEGSR